MTVENWKLWLVPFGVWGAVMAWYSGYQSGFKEGHETAWQMYRPSAFVVADVSNSGRLNLGDGRLATK